MIGFERKSAFSIPQMSLLALEKRETSYQITSLPRDVQNIEVVARRSIIINEERDPSLDVRLLISEEVNHLKSLGSSENTGRISELLQKTMIENVANEKQYELIQLLVEKGGFSRNSRSLVVSRFLDPKNCDSNDDVIQFLHENGGLDNRKDQIIRKACSKGFLAILEYFDGRDELGSINDDLIVEAVLQGNLNTVDFLERTGRISEKNRDELFFEASAAFKASKNSLEIMKCLAKSGKVSDQMMNIVFFEMSSSSCDRSLIQPILQYLEKTGKISNLTRSRVVLHALSNDEEISTQSPPRESTTSCCVIS